MKIHIQYDNGSVTIQGPVRISFYVTDRGDLVIMGDGGTIASYACGHWLAAVIETDPEVK